MLSFNYLLYWLPRVIAIVFTVFLGIFALDALAEAGSILEKTAGLIIHLIPNYILVALTVIAWRNEKVGGMLFVLWAITFTLFFKTYSEPVSFLLVSLSVFVVGILFFIQGRYRIKHR